MPQDLQGCWIYAFKGCTYIGVDHYGFLPLPHSSLLSWVNVVGGCSSLRCIEHKRITRIISVSQAKYECKVVCACFNSLWCRRRVFIRHSRRPCRTAEIEYFFLTNIIRNEAGECLIGFVPSSKCEIDGWIHLTVLIREFAVVITSIDFACCGDLFCVGHVFGLLAAFLHGAKHRESNAGQNGDNRN